MRQLFFSGFCNAVLFWGIGKHAAGKGADDRDMEVLKIKIKNYVAKCSELWYFINAKGGICMYVDEMLNKAG